MKRGKYLWARRVWVVWRVGGENAELRLVERAESAWSRGWDVVLLPRTRGATDRAHFSPYTPHTKAYDPHRDPPEIFFRLANPSLTLLPTGTSTKPTHGGRKLRQGSRSRQIHGAGYEKVSSIIQA